MKIFLKIKLVMMVIMSLQVFSTERPNYKVLLKEGSYEIRQYEAYFVAETKYQEGTDRGFQRLFKYISGANQDQLKIEMTAPVTIHKENGMQVMAFMIPDKFSESEIPIPTNAKVQIKKIPARLVASNTYSWFSSEAKNKRKTQELSIWLRKQGDYQVISQSIYAGYDSPYTLPQNRTHEMMFVLKVK